MTEPSLMLRFPDVLESWPWPRRVNPYFHEVKAESDAWIESFHCFDAQGMKVFNYCNTSLLAGMAYPVMSREHLRTACDLMQIFFVFDAQTDIADAERAQELARIVTEVLHNPHLSRPKGENIIGEITKQFWERGLKSASQTSARRFVTTFDAYVRSVAEQAKDRSEQRIRDVGTYMNLRRFTIGCRPSFALQELGMDMPDGIMNHPIMERLMAITTDLIILGNDMYSYNKEQAAGDDAHNIITVVMHHHNKAIAGAMEWVEVEFQRLVNEFLQLSRSEPFWSADVDGMVSEYIDGLGNWVRANDSWSFESGRYFGDEGLNIQRVRCVGLFPRVKNDVNVL